MALTYAQYKTVMKTMMAVSDEAEVNFVVILPTIIAYAEDRIYQELDLIKQQSEVNADLTPGTRTVSVPGSILIVHSVDVVTPTATIPASGTRRGLIRVSLGLLNFVSPVAAATGVPRYYTLQDDTTLVLAPTPDAAYKIAVLGPVRPPRLSVSNTTTWISTNLESLFVAASMVLAAGYQKNFGAQADDPKMAVSWETQYQTLKSSAEVEEARRKAQSVNWTPYTPAPLAREPR